MHSEPPTGHLLAIGGGYVARALAQKLLKLGYEISATTRTTDKLRALSQSGIAPVRWDSNAPDEPPSLPAPDHVTHILISSPPVDGNCPAAKLAPLLASLPKRALLIYLSSSAVYGDHDGDWVDESSALQPSNARGIARLDAEQFWQNWGVATATHVQIHRLSGIYGPGRNALATLKRRENLKDPTIGQSILKQGQVFNRIHLDDIVGVLLECILSTPPPEVGGPITRREVAIFNHADDLPAAPQDVIAYAASLLNLPAPPLIPFEGATLSAMQRSFYADNKRIRNTKIKSLLGGKLSFPTFREGLEDLLNSDGG